MEEISSRKRLPPSATSINPEALAFLEQEGLRVLKSLLAKDEDEAVRMARSIGFPVALKISSADVIHKTETGGIRVDLKDEEEVRKVFGEIVGTFAANSPEKGLDGVMVQALGRGFELIVGKLTDQQFGPVLMFGLGGTYVEAVNDVCFRMIPLEPRDAREMIAELQGYSVLKNPRQGTIHLPAVENFLLQVSSLMEKHPEIQEMDLNPVFAASRDVVICDAMIKSLWDTSSSTRFICMC